jgi:protein-tyrosine phosphatase
MNMKVTRGFTVRFMDGTYEITRDGSARSPMLYYDRDPEGAARKFLCIMEDATLTLPAPLPGERLYFFLEQEDGSQWTAASRRVEISGVENFRDLGGYQTADFRQVKWGRFFRGGPISGLGPAEKASIDNLGLKRVFDYRTEREHVRVPDDCPNGAENIWVPAVPPEKRFQDFADRDMLAHLKTVNTAKAAQDSFQLFKDLYAAMPFQSGAFRQMLLSLDSCDTVPMYQHCSAGKDRTGVGSALLLLALGVPEETVMEDYLLSRDYRREVNLRHVEKLVEGGISKVAEELVLKMMMTGIEELISAALSAIRIKYPSYEAFFLGEYGITGEQLNHWRDMHTQSRFTPGKNVYN